MKTLCEIVLPTDQQPIATCTSYVFLHATTALLAKLIFYMKNKKTEYLKFQRRLSKKNSFSKYLENIKSQNVLIQRYLYDIQKCSVKTFSYKFPEIDRKTPVL